MKRIKVDPKRRQQKLPAISIEDVETGDLMYARVVHIDGPSSVHQGCGCGTDGAHIMTDAVVRTDVNQPIRGPNDKQGSGDHEG